MMEELWEKIVKNQEVRQNLSKLRMAVKKEGASARLPRRILEDGDRLIKLLKDEDAKTRKNAALLMGELGKSEFLEPLFEAYQAEPQLFVRSSYLAAMKNFDYREYLDRLRRRQKELLNVKPEKEQEKHVTEELRELTELLLAVEGAGTHKFTGYAETYDVVLLTNRNHRELTERQLSKLEPFCETRVFNAGVMARVTDLHWVFKLRLYQELLFRVEGMTACPMEPVKAAEVIVKSDLFSFLSRGHQGEPPYYFRVEVKSKMDLDKKSAFTKKLADQLEKLSKRRLVNSTSHYELEIRVVENKAAGANLLVKLFTLKDRRFSYRREVMSTSLRPYNAALTVALAKPYLREGAQVLDPFCGVGTMVIERHKAVSANTTYGIDIQEEAVRKARINAETAGQVIHFINRDFFDFRHEYKFDEIITDLPFQQGRGDQERIQSLYERFFYKASEVLAGDGVVILYTHDRPLVRMYASKSGFATVEEYEISMKEGTYVIILKRKEESGGLL